MTRREAAKALMVGGCGVAAGLAGVALLDRAFSSPLPAPLPLLRAADLPPGSIHLFPEADVAVVRTHRGVAFLSMRCTHMGCRLRLAGQAFVCPCHGGRFSREGVVLGGPPRRDMRRLEGGLLDDGTLFVIPGSEAGAGAWVEL
jgi:cytochrome b6-f complex iron-sulfur subunit